MSEDPMVEEFFGEVNDKYYPQVLDGLGKLDAGNVQEAIEILARPLHTIKGVAGFMAGFEAASTFTHKVEDYLKKLQAGGIEANEENVVLASRAVNMVFGVLEQIRSTGAPDEEETGSVLGAIAAIMGGGPQRAAAPVQCVRAELREGAAVLRIMAPRVHLKAERDAVGAAIAATPPGSVVLLELSGVLTFSSQAWAEAASWGDTRRLCASGLGVGCKGLFYAWGMDAHIRLFEDELDFWRAQGAGETGRQ